ADAQCREFLGITAAAAAPYGLYVMLEALNEHACNYITCVPEALDLLQAARLPDVGLVLDFYHMEIMGEGLDLIPSAAPWLLHTHVSSCGPSRERGFPQEDEYGRYRSILRALLAVDYDATMSIEPDTFEPEAAATSLAMLRRAYESLL
ncbi:MAG: sugar phosphate isomerase/epimerase, partial [Oscillospiraceae bacterium]|nr:sugar phosphate isomerase/epimerase [Oscillospiraceae bacterium]